jgi:hypothetical protein
VNLKLTDAFIKGVKTQPKTKSYPDGHGLVLLVNPQGSMGWRYRYRFGGKAKMLSFGTYPEVSLKRANAELDTGTTTTPKGIDTTLEALETINRG